MCILNHAFDDFLPKDDAIPNLDVYPVKLREKINEVNSWLMPSLNNSIYKAGFACTQVD